jgi:hypothetical protein
MVPTLRKIVRCSGVPMVVMGVATAPVLADDQFTTSHRTEVLNQAVSGPGRASSFLDAGTHVFHETDLYLQGQALGGQWNLTVNGTVRYTDSRQFDPERVSTQKLEWRLSDAHTQIHLGDYFANLSPYALTKGVKGLAVQRNLGDDQNYVRVVYGSFANEWAFLLKDLAREPMATYGGGIRMQKAWEQFRFGLNLAEAHDEKSAARASFPAYAQILPALDWEYRDGGLVVSGEHAYSDTTETPLAGGASRQRSGSAHKLVLRAALKDINLDGQVERVASDFISRGGGATPDRLRYYAKADYKLTREWRLFAIFDDYRDNLDGRLSATTAVTTWETGVKRSRAFGRRHMNVALSWRNRDKELSDASFSQRTNRIKLRVNDRWAEDYDWRVEVERILDRDRRTASGAASTLFDLGLGYRHRIENSWELRADVDVGRQENGTLNAAGSDVSNLLRLGLTADRGDGTVFGLSFERNAADLFAAASDNRHKRGAISWQSTPAWLHGGSVRLEYADFIHRFEQAAANNYRERVFKVLFQWNLDSGGKK